MLDVRLQRVSGPQRVWITLTAQSIGAFKQHSSKSLVPTCAAAPCVCEVPDYVVSN